MLSSKIQCSALTKINKQCKKTAKSCTMYRWSLAQIYQAPRETYDLEHRSSLDAYTSGASPGLGLIKSCVW